MSTRLQEQVDLITDTLEKSPESGASCLLESMSPAEISRVIESLPWDLRSPLWLKLPRLKKGEMLLHHWLQGIRSIEINRNFPAHHSKGRKQSEQAKNMITMQMRYKYMVYPGRIMSEFSKLDLGSLPAID